MPMVSRQYPLEEFHRSSSVIKRDSFHVPRPSYHYEYSYQRQYTHQHPEDYYSPRSSSSSSYSSPRSSSSPTSQMYTERETSYSYVPVAGRVSHSTGRSTFGHNMHHLQPSLALISSPEYKVAAAVGATSAPRARRRRTIPPGASQSTKRCHYPDCDKISVSRGLCRGHGGGRRCQHEACVKGAQSRSDFCWAHGGGQRCEVKGCMRSRKSKRFCVAHVNMESSDTSCTSSPEHKVHIAPPKTIVQIPSLLKLPPPAANPGPLLPSTMGRCAPLTSSNGLSPFKLPSLHQLLKKNNTLEVAQVVASLSTSRAS